MEYALLQAVVLPLLLAFPLQKEDKVRSKVQIWHLRNLKEQLIQLLRFVRFQMK